MKIKIFTLLVFVCSLGAFTSCSEEEITPNSTFTEKQSGGLTREDPDQF